MYPSEKFRNEVLSLINTKTKISKDKIESVLEIPPQPEMGELSLPCFKLAAELKKEPQRIADEIAVEIEPSGLVKEIRIAGPYVNFYADWEKFAELIIKTILKEKERYGSSSEGKGKTIVIDYSSPNIAKSMSVGHLRSAVIGSSLYRIFEFLGYKCIGDNHLGDWGTQFGKLLCAYEKWGSEEKLKKNPIREMLNLYVKFHKEAEEKPELEEKARECFKKLEEGDKRYMKLWKWFWELSVGEFKKIYKRLGISFDFYLGESEYVKGSMELIKKLLKSGKARKSEGAVIIDLKKYNLPPLLIQKSDEATLYSTRDLATIEYRMKRFKPWKILYVVGAEQKLYFQQIFKAAELLGLCKESDCVHVDFGLMSLLEGKISTREGRVVFLNELIGKTIEKAEKIITKKNPKLGDRKKVAEIVGIGVIKYNDLSRDRVKNMVFDWKQALSFEGNTAPYIQYTYARTNSIFRKGKINKVPKFDASVLKDPKERILMKTLMGFPKAVSDAARDYKPHYIANYVYNLATQFNDFYETLSVLKAEPEQRNARLALVKAVQQVVKNALFLLGIEAPEKM